MTGHPERGSANWLAARAAADPAVISRAHRYLTEGRRSNDACLMARRYTEWQWRLDPVRPPERQAWRDAARLREDAGDPAAAAVLQAAADMDPELDAMAAAWIARYQIRPDGEDQTVLARHLAEQTVRPAGDPAVPGIDGSWYQLAEMQC